MKQAVQRLLGRAGYRIQGIRYTPRQLLDPAQQRPLTFDDAVCRLMFERGPALRFVQVGAYDGVSTDPLRKYIDRCGWSGVLVEPMPRPAAALRELYADNPRVTVVEAAVDSQAGSRPMFTVEGQDVPKWAGGMSSFSREHLVSHEYALPGISALIQETRAACVTFADVLAKLPPGPLDILQVDTEGADALILSLFPFERLTPALIQWEVKVMPRAEQEAVMDRLAAYGYRFARSGDEDMLALLA